MIYIENMSNAKKKVDVKKVIKRRALATIAMDELVRLDEELSEMEAKIKQSQIKSASPVLSEPLIEEGDDMLIENSAKLPEVKFPEEKY